MTEIKWEHKDFELKDKDSILALRFRVFNESHYTEERWNWQYQLNPNGKAVINLAVDKIDSTILAGHYAVIPYNLIWDKHKTKSAQSLDTFTSPDYQRQGIFIDLAEKNYADCSKFGIKLIFGFPNQASYGGFVKKLGFSDPFGFKVFRKPLRLGYYSNRLFKNNLIGNIPINFSSSTMSRRVESISEKIIPVLNKFNTLFPNMIERSLEYLVWRYEKCPDRNYQFYHLVKNNNIEGFFILNFDEANSYTHLVDFAVKDLNDFSLILDASIAESLKLKSLCLTYFTNENHLFEKQLYDKGFNAKDKSAQFRFIIRNLTDLKDLPESTLQSINWHITPGDTDFY